MQECELLQSCGFFKNYLKSNEELIQLWIKLYCRNKEKSEQCKRKQYRKQHGTPPPDNMSPTGTMLPS